MKYIGIIFAIACIFIIIAIVTFTVVAYINHAFAEYKIIEKKFLPGTNATDIDFGNVTLDDDEEDES